MEDFKWTSTPSEEIEYKYTYQKTHKTFYGIHQIKIQYKDNSPVEVTAKFDTGAKSSSISYDVAKKIGVEPDLLEIAKLIEAEEISKEHGKSFIKSKIKDLSETYRGIELDYVKSASGSTIRLYIPITIYYDGEIKKSSANLKDRTGLKAEMLVGLNDII